MKKSIKILSILMIVFSLFGFTACGSDDEYDIYMDRRTVAIGKCCGSCLTREQVAVLLNEFETTVQQVYDNMECLRSDKSTTETIEPAILITPGEHEHDENTRYKITPTGGDVVFTGIKVEVMSDTSACKIEDNNQSQAKDDISDEPLEIIKGWWWNDKNEFIFNLENEMRDYPKRFVVEKDGTVHVNRSKKEILIIRIIDHDHIAIHFTGKSETEEIVLTRGDKPYWAN